MECGIFSGPFKDSNDKRDILKGNIDNILSLLNEKIERFVIVLFCSSYFY